MSGIVMESEARQLQAAIDALGDEGARAAFRRLLEVLETSPGAVVLPAGEFLSTQQAAQCLGVSRMTVVRLIDRGALRATSAGVHRKVQASELERYLRERSAKRGSSLESLAADADPSSVDEVIRTR